MSESGPVEVGELCALRSSLRSDTTVPRNRVDDGRPVPTVKICEDGEDDGRTRRIGFNPLAIMEPGVARGQDVLERGQMTVTSRESLRRGRLPVLTSTENAFDRLPQAAP